MPPGFREYAMDFNGRARANLLFCPPRLREPAPLLLALHGGGGNPAVMARITRFDVIARAEGFVVAYAAGCGPRPRRLNWNAGGPEYRGWSEKHRIDDIGFLRALIRRLQADYPIDPERIYVTGMSKGGMMAYRLACEASDVITAIGAVAATMVVPCERMPKKVAVVHVHGALDQNVPLAGGRGRLTFSRAPWPPVRTGIDYWRAANGCAPAVRLETGDPEVRHFHAPAGNGAADVDLFLLARCGHAWPGSRPRLIARLLGMRSDTPFDASRQIWDFLKGKCRSRVQA